MKWYYVLLPLAILSCKSPEARIPLQHKSGDYLKASAELNIKRNAIEKQQIQAVIDTITDKSFIASNQGFWYAYTTKNTTSKQTPQFGDLLKFQYNISTINGKPIYTTKELGTQSYLMDKAELFTGLREGLKLMKPNESMTFIFPSYTAFGYYGDENKIGANTPIICNVTLNSILKNND